MSGQVLKSVKCCNTYMHILHSLIHDISVIIHWCYGFFIDIFTNKITYNIPEV